MENPNEITLDSVSKSFEYEKQAREIDECRDVEELRNLCKMYLKLYLKQQEVIGKIGL
jgi:hypothetical protein